MDMFRFGQFGFDSLRNLQVGDKVNTEQKKTRFRKNAMVFPMAMGILPSSSQFVQWVQPHFIPSALCNLIYPFLQGIVACRYIDKSVFFTTVSHDVRRGYKTAHRLKKAGFAYFRPQAANPKTATSRNEGAYSVVIVRPRRWNFKQVELHGAFPDINAEVSRRTNCLIRGSHKESI